MKAPPASTRTGPRRILIAPLSLLASLTLPVVQLAINGGISVCLAMVAPRTSWMAIACWMAAMASVGAIVHHVSTRREPGDAALPTNASAIILEITQVVTLGSMWILFAPDNLLTRATIGLFAGLTAFDVLDRMLFVRRMHRTGGVKAEARRITERIISEHPDDAHGLIAEENVKRRDRSRLHWQLGAALSDENVALYQREALQREKNVVSQFEFHRSIC